MGTAGGSSVNHACISSLHKPPLQESGQAEERRKQPWAEDFVDASCGRRNRHAAERPPGGTAGWGAAGSGKSAGGGAVRGERKATAVSRPLRTVGSSFRSPDQGGLDSSGSGLQGYIFVEETIRVSFQPSDGTCGQDQELCIRIPRINLYYCLAPRGVDRIFSPRSILGSF